MKIKTFCDSDDFVIAIRCGMENCYIRDVVRGDIRIFKVAVRRLNYCFALFEANKQKYKQISSAIVQLKPDISVETCVSNHIHLF